MVLPFARVRAHGAQYDRAQHRAPYGTAWFTSGTGRQRPQEVEITLRIESLGVLSSAAVVTRNTVALLRSADVIEAPTVHLLNPSVLSFSAAPAAGGAYDVTVRVSAIHTLPAIPYVVTYEEAIVTFDGAIVVYEA